MLLNLDWQIITIGEDEETFTVKVKPLDYPAYQKILSLFDMKSVSSGLTQKQQERIATDFNPMTNPEMRNILKEILPTHAKELEGLQLQIDGEIRTATVQDLVEISQLLVLATTLMIRIFKISTIIGGKREESKKP